MLFILNFDTYSWNQESESFFDSLDYIGVGPVPVGSLPEAHHLPGNDTERPHVRRARELGVRDSFGCRPSNWNLATLRPVHTLGGRALNLAA